MTERSILTRLGVADADGAAAQIERFSQRGSTAFVRLGNSTIPVNRAFVAVDKGARGIASGLGQATQAFTLFGGPVAAQVNQLGLLTGALRNINPFYIAGAAAVAGVTAATAGATAAGAGFERSQLRTTALLKATGNASGLTAKEIDGITRSLAESTLATIDQARQAGDSLLTFKAISEDAFGRTLGLAQDLASAGFGQLTSNVTQLGKALQDPILGLSALGESGVSFTSTQKELIKGFVEVNDLASAQGVIFEVLETQLGGAGAAEASGLTGAVDRLTTSFGGLFEQLSERSGITDFLTAEFGRVQGLVDAVRKTVEEADSSVARIAELDQALNREQTRLTVARGAVARGDSDPDGLRAARLRAIEIGINAILTERNELLRRAGDEREEAARVQDIARRRGADERQRAQEDAEEEERRTARLKAIEDARKDAAKEREAAITNIARLEDAAELAGRTPQQRIFIEADRELAELEDLLARGIIRLEEFERARVALFTTSQAEIAKLQDAARDEERDKALKAAKEIADEEAKLTEARLREEQRLRDEFNRAVLSEARTLAADLSGFLVDSFVNVDRAGQSVFENIFEGAEALGRRFITRLAAQLLEANLFLPITASIVGAAPGLFGIQQPGAAGPAGSFLGGGGIPGVSPGNILFGNQGFSPFGSQGLFGDTLSTPLFGSGLSGGAGGSLLIPAATNPTGSGFLGLVGGGAPVGGVPALGPTTTLGGFLGGAGLGFAAGSFLPSLGIGSPGLGNTLGSGGGALAGAAIGSIVPGVGTVLGGLAGGLLGGGIGGLFGGDVDPGPPGSFGFLGAGGGVRSSADNEGDASIAAGFLSNAFQQLEQTASALGLAINRTNDSFRASVQVNQETGQIIIKTEDATASFNDEAEATEFLVKALVLRLDGLDDEFRDLIRDSTNLQQAIDQIQLLTIIRDLPKTVEELERAADQTELQKQAEATKLQFEQLTLELERVGLTAERAAKAEADLEAARFAQLEFLRRGVLRGAQGELDAVSPLSPVEAQLFATRDRFITFGKDLEALEGPLDQVNELAAIRQATFEQILSGLINDVQTQILTITEPFEATKAQLEFEANQRADEIRRAGEFAGKSDEEIEREVDKVRELKFLKLNALQAEQAAAKAAQEAAVQQSAAAAAAQEAAEAQQLAAAAQAEAAEIERQRLAALNLVEGGLGGIESFIRTIQFGSQSPLTQEQQLAEAQKQFAVNAAAAANDFEAFREFPTFGSTLVSELQASFGSGTGFVSGVRDVLTSAQTITNRTVNEFESLAATFERAEAANADEISIRLGDKLDEVKTLLRDAISATGGVR